MPSCCFPGSSLQALSGGCFWKLFSTLLGEFALTSLGKLRLAEKPQIRAHNVSEPLASVGNKECVGFTCLFGV